MDPLCSVQCAEEGSLLWEEAATAAAPRHEIFMVLLARVARVGPCKMRFRSRGGATTPICSTGCLIKTTEARSWNGCLIRTLAASANRRRDTMETITPGSRRSNTCVVPKRKINLLLSPHNVSPASNSPGLRRLIVVPPGDAAKWPCERRLPQRPADWGRRFSVGLASLVAFSERQRHQRGPCLRPDGQPAAS